MKHNTSQQYGSTGKWLYAALFGLLGVIFGTSIGIAIGHGSRDPLLDPLLPTQSQSASVGGVQSNPQSLLIQLLAALEKAQALQQALTQAGKADKDAGGDSKSSFRAAHIDSSATTASAAALSGDMAAGATSTIREVEREHLHCAFAALQGRGDIPELLNNLGLVGESVEVGVRKGDFSKHILLHGKGSRHHMVDPWEHQNETLYLDISNRDDSWQNHLYTDLQNFMEKNYPNRYELHRGYSVQVADKDFADESLDFVYLDARHDEAGLAEDMVAWWPKLKKGGLFAGHDYVPDGKIHAGVFGVQAAVFKFTKRVKREVMSISDKDRNGGRSEPQHVDGGWTTWYFFK